MTSDEKARGNGQVTTGQFKNTLHTTISPDCLQERISVFGNAYATKPEGDMSIADFIGEIRSPADDPHAMLVADIRTAIEDFRNDDADKLKKDLPAVTLSGRVTKGNRAKAMGDGRFEHSGFLQIDLDGKDIHPRTPEEVRDLIGTAPHVVAAFLSPSGTGAKAILRMPKCATEEEHKLAFAAAEDYFAETYGLKIDTSCKDPARLCFLSHDPEAVVAAGEVAELVVAFHRKGDDDKPATLPKLPSTPSTPPAAPADKSAGLVIKSSERDALTLADLEAMVKAMPRPDYDPWVRFCNGAWQTFGTEATRVLAAGWPEEVPGEYDKKFAARFTDGTVAIGTCVHLAQTHGNYRPPVRARMASLNITREHAERIDEAVVGSRFLLALDDETRGLAQAYADIRFGQRCYVHDENAWRYHDGGIWKRDETDATLDDLQANLTPLLVESANEKIRKLDPKEHRARIDLLRKKSKSLYNLRTARAVLDNAAALQEFRAVRGQFDQAPHLLAIKTGVLDFDCVLHREHRAGDMLTTAAPIEYDPEATCPAFDQFIAEITTGDAQLADFLLESVAIGMTGHTDHDYIWFHYGGGNNGKSTFTHTIRELLGPICSTFDSALLVGNRESSADDYKRAAFEGCRLAIGDELPEGRKLRVEELKKLVGGDSITARNPYEKPREFRPTHKAWLVGNHKPTVETMDHGTWRRLLLVPWNARFTGDGPPRAVRVAHHVAEGAGILNRLLDAWGRVKHRGLVIPEAVRTASAEYQQCSDQVAEFVDSRIKRIEGHDVALKFVRKAYDVWLEDEGEKPAAASNKKLGEELRRLGFKTRRAGTGYFVCNAIVME